MIAVPVAIGAAVVGGVAWLVAKKRKPKGMTPERNKVFVAALRELKDPVKLRALADQFDKEGLKYQAGVLRRRAGLRELPPKVKKERRKALAKGLASKDRVAVENLAQSFEKEGASGAAEALRQHAKGLTPAKKK